MPIVNNRSLQQWRLGLALLTLLVWGLLHVWWYPMGDDLLFTQLNRGPDVDFSPGQWLTKMWGDWAHRNGRLSDSVLRLTLRPGYDTFKVTGPVMLALLGLVCSQWLSITRNRPVAVWAGMAALPVTLALWPAFTGDGVYWAAGAVNYIWPTVGTVAASAGYLRLLSGQRPSRGVAIALGLVGIMAQLMHELASISLGGMAVLTLALLWRRRVMGRGLLPAMGVLGTFLQMCAPGLWSRLGKTTAARPPAPLPVRLTNSVEVLVSHTLPLWVALLLGLAAAAMLCRGWKRWVLGAGALSCACLVIAIVANPGWGSRPAQPSAVPITFLLVTTVLLVAVALLVATPLLGEAPVLAWVACVGCWGPPALVGLWGARAYLIPALWLMLAVMSTGLALLDHVPAPQQVARVLGVVLALVSLAWFVPTLQGVRANAHWNETWLEPQLAAARTGQLDRVLFPTRPLDTTYAYYNTYRLAAYAGPLRKVNSLPDEVELKNAPIEAIEADPRVQQLVR